MKNVLADVEQGRLDEAAFPAYSHPSTIRRLALLGGDFSYRDRDYLQERTIVIDRRRLTSAVEDGVMLPFRARMLSRKVVRRWMLNTASP